MLCSHCLQSNSDQFFFQEKWDWIVFKSIYHLAVNSTRIETNAWEILGVRMGR